MVPIHINSSSIKNRITAANHASEKNQNEVSACGNFLSLKACNWSVDVYIRHSIFYSLADILRDRRKKTKIAPKKRTDGRSRHRDDFSRRHFIQCALFFLNPAYGLTGSGIALLYLKRADLFLLFIGFLHNSQSYEKYFFLSPIAIKLNHHGKSWRFNSESKPCRT